MNAITTPPRHPPTQGSEAHAYFGIEYSRQIAWAAGKRGVGVGGGGGGVEACIDTPATFFIFVGASKINIQVCRCQKRRSLTLFEELAKRKHVQLNN